MEFFTNELVIAIFFILISLIIYLSWLLNKWVEESTLLTLRLKIKVFGAFSFLIILSTLAIDICYQDKLFEKLLSKSLLDIVYGALVLVAGSKVVLRYLKHTNYEKIFLILALTILFVRFVLKLTEYNDLFYAITLFTFLILYASLIIRRLEEMTVWRRLLTWFITLSIVIISCLVLERFVRLNGYYFTYLLVLYLILIWERYFWNLEYKRRKACPTCGGWGKNGTQDKKRKWWAVGYKKRSRKADCKTCASKGWVHRHEKLLHD